MTRSFQDYLLRARAKWGEKFSASSLDVRFVTFYENQKRIKIDTCGTVITGTVGVTTGWVPVFILLRTKRSFGSAWTLTPSDIILAVQRGREYVEVPCTPSA